MSNPTNNTLMHTADRGTHLKIVVVSLVASIAVMAVGIYARTLPGEGARLEASAPVKPGKAIYATQGTTTAIR